MKLNTYERELLEALESGEFVPTATREELQRFRESARATAKEDQPITMLLSTGDHKEIQTRAMQEAISCQVFSNVPLKYVTGRTEE